MTTKEDAHAELRRRGCTDDVHATGDACIVTLFFWLLAFATLASTVA